MTKEGQILHHLRRIDKRRKMLLEKPEAMRGAWAYYAEHPAEFINDWVFTYDPRTRDEQKKPFILFPRQVEYINWLHERFKNNDEGAASKCRDVGFTWVNCAFGVWLWLFKGQVNVSYLSNKMFNVDVLQNLDAILPRIRYIIDNLPHFFKPKGYDPKIHAPVGKIVNPETGATIIGYSGDNAGRAGRSTMMFIDEAGFIERMNIVNRAVSQNSPCRIYVSTYNGPTGVFFLLMKSLPIDNKFIFKWQDDPRKDQDWYKAQKEKFKHDPVGFAQEVDGNPYASVENICIPYEYVQAAINFDIPAEGMRVAGLDVADGGGDVNAISIRKGSVTESISAWAQGDTTQTARKAAGICISEKVDKLHYDSIGVGAGVRGEMNAQAREKGFNIAFAGVAVSESPSDGLFQNTDKKNKDMFANLKAELWWNVRTRFEKTYEHIQSIKSYHIDEMISIPDDQELIDELCAPKYETNEAGKIIIESKKAMKKRGINSPNKADALVLSFYHVNINPSILLVKPHEKTPPRKVASESTGKPHRNPYVITR